MAAELSCTNCGGAVKVAAGHGRAKIRCEHCGYYTGVPAELRDLAEPDPDDTPVPTTHKLPTKAQRTDRKAPVPTPSGPVVRVMPQIDPNDHRATFEVDNHNGPKLLEGTTDEDDDLPYSVPGDGLIACTNCMGKLPPDAKVCAHCGINLRTGKKPKRSYEPIDKSWESVATLSLRIKVFAGIQLMNLLMLTLIGLSGFNLAAVMFVLANVALQAFILGSYDRFELRRTAKGAATMTRVWRICFVPRTPAKIDWKKCHTCGIIPVHDIGIAEWAMLLILTFFGLSEAAGWFMNYEITGLFGIVGTIFVLSVAIAPPILWYAYVMFPDSFHLALGDVYGSTDTIIFRTRDRDLAVEIAELISNSTSLLYRKVM